MTARPIFILEKNIQFSPDVLVKSLWFLPLRMLDALESLYPAAQVTQAPIATKTTRDRDQRLHAACRESTRAMLELFKPLQVLTSYDDQHCTEGDCLWKDLGQLALADSEDTAGP